MHDGSSRLLPVDDREVSQGHAGRGGGARGHGSVQLHNGNALRRPGSQSVVAGGGKSVHRHERHHPSVFASRGRSEAHHGGGDVREHLLVRGPTVQGGPAGPLQCGMSSPLNCWGVLGVAVVPYTQFVEQPHC